MNNMAFGEFKVDVQTTNNRGSTPEEVAHRCVGKIVAFSEDTHPMGGRHSGSERGGGIPL